MLFRGKVTNPDFWLVGLVALVLLRYAVDYANAAKSLQVVVLLTGIVMGKGVALWTAWPKRPLTLSLSPSEGERVSAGRVRGTLCILAFLLAASALWQPEMGMEFHYHGVRRWEGVWENPNTYGLLMGVGLVLALGLLVASSKFQVPGEREGFMQLATRHMSRIALLVAAGLCGFGLLKSYSRGSWLGTACALAALLFQLVKFQVPSGVAGRMAVMLRRNWFPSSILLLAILVICFWQFRHTESPLVRRVFSAGNVNDFSWRNRVSAWQGAARMMWDKPLAGFGWGRAEDAYHRDYHAARLEETAAIQLNDYLMLGISVGAPALLCLLTYISLVGYQTLRRPFGDSQEPSTFYQQPAITAAVGVMVFLVGFWFEGGLFKLPTTVVFWVLLELARSSSRGNEVQITPARKENVPNPISRCEPQSRSRRREEAEKISTQRRPSRSCGGYSGNVLGELRPPTMDAHRGHEPHQNPSPGLRPPSPHPMGRGQGEGTVHGKESNSDGLERLTANNTKPAKGERALRWVAGLVATLAVAQTVLHLGLPQFAVNERTLSLARSYLISAGDKADFDYLASQPSWFGKPLKHLIQQAELAHYNRRLVNWKIDDATYRRFVLSSGIDPAWDGEMDWRRPLWEFFYPRIRKETSLAAAAETVGRELRERIKIRTGERAVGDIQSLWREQAATAAGFERLYVAALRSAGIPARLSQSDQAEFWNGNDWLSAPRAAGQSPGIGQPL